MNDLVMTSNSGAADADAKCVNIESNFEALALENMIKKAAKLKEQSEKLATRAEQCEHSAKKSRHVIQLVGDWIKGIAGGMGLKALGDWIKGIQSAGDMDIYNLSDEDTANLSKFVLGGDDEKDALLDALLSSANLDLDPNLDAASCDDLLQKLHQQPKKLEQEIKEAGEDVKELVLRLKSVIEEVEKQFHANSKRMREIQTHETVDVQKALTVTLVLEAELKQLVQDN